ncbi:hypothetical protein G4B88_026838 [Cannabis sativa]|uniref:Uncharacterized protein n=1 Tax=Cannabis sativa TaxID=3483 RepID=A0A7J6EB45_CANSA|nr:hypothetical protein G4B88_026838 [Cannabis sativa]
MARELISFLLLLLVANYNTHATKISEAPSPQPQLNTTTGKPYMHGIKKEALNLKSVHLGVRRGVRTRSTGSMHVLLQKVLRNMSVCASWDLWKQASMPLLQ